MVGIEEFSRVVSDLHAATGVPEKWGTVFTDITRCLDATACTVVSQSAAGRSLVATTISDEAASTYERYYHRLDFIVDACHSGSVGTVRSGWEIVAKNRKSEFYHDWQRRYDMTDGLLVRLNDDKAGFVLSAPPRDQPYGTAEQIRFVNALVPHLRQALQADKLLRHSGLEHSDLTAVADVVRHGVVVVGRDGRIDTMNSAARRIAQAKDGLLFGGNVIAAASVSHNAQLQRCMAQAVGAQTNSGRRGSNLICGRPSGKRPYILLLLPLDTDGGPGSARVAIVIIDPDHEVKPPKPLLRALFGLTEAEAGVALRMLSGDGLQAIADDFSLSIGTVKTHAQRLFQKTGTHRQGELIRLLGNIIA